MKDTLLNKRIKQNENNYIKKEDCIPLGGIMEKLKKHLRPDHQMFDEVKVVTVPRYKESEMSGDEWRISASIEYLCKGKVMHRAAFRDIETALDFVKAEYHKGCDMGRDDIQYEDLFCDQEGCNNKPIAFFKLKKQYGRDGEIKGHQFEQHRSFCSTHERRGDCGLEDADSNYELIDSVKGSARK